MKIYLDSANLEELKTCLERGCIRGVTTNPSILSKEPKTDFVKHIQKMADLCMEFGQAIPLSVEVFTTDPEEMVTQALQLCEQINYDNINIKVPIGWDELEVIRRLTEQGIRVNCTCIFNEAQSILAASAGAKYISIFMGRLSDIGGDPIQVISTTRQLLDDTNSSAEIIAASIRSGSNIVEAFSAGAHIATAGSSLFKKMAVHPQTDKSVQGFLNDFQAWIREPASV